MFILWWIIVGLIAGFVTGKLMKGSGFGAVMDIVVGIGGQGGLIYTVLVAVIGAVILTLMLRLITGNKSKNL
jgi:uncharacterized membrane protein YeaQ/YmgE (transglycosylase-associated protein family)